MLQLVDLYRGNFPLKLPIFDLQPLQGLHQILLRVEIGLNAKHLFVFLQFNHSLLIKILADGIINEMFVLIVQHGLCKAVGVLERVRLLIPEVVTQIRILLELLIRINVLLIVTFKLLYGQILIVFTIFIIIILLLFYQRRKPGQFLKQARVPPSLLRLLLDT